MDEYVSPPPAIVSDRLIREVMRARLVRDRGAFLTLRVHWYSQDGTHLMRSWGGRDHHLSASELEAAVLDIANELFSALITWEADLTWPELPGL